MEESDEPLPDVGADGTADPTDDEAGFLRLGGRPRRRAGADGPRHDPAPLRARAGALVDRVVTQLEARPEVRSRALQQLWDAELTLSEEYLSEQEARLAERRLTELEIELAEGAAKIRPR